MFVLEKNIKIKNIEEQAYALGFDGFGITSSELGEAGYKLSQWLEMGYEGEMAYMARGEEKRRNPNLVLENIKSIICLRTNYLTQNKGMEFLSFPENGDVSLYALNKYPSHTLCHGTPQELAMAPNLSRSPIDGPAQNICFKCVLLYEFPCFWTPE